MKIGYVRVSTQEQNTIRQEALMEELGVFRGSMPELYADPNVDWETYYRSYVNTYLQRDIRNLAQVADERVVKMPLLHFLDTGLAAYLLRWGNPDALEKGSVSGAFFETYVFTEIHKSYLNTGKEPPIFYYRDKDQKEIDLLIYQNGTLSSIEIKKSASPNKAAIKIFHVLAPIHEPKQFGGLDELKVTLGTGNVICMAQDLLPLDEQNWRVPVWLI